MRLDHLLSKEECLFPSGAIQLKRKNVSRELLSIVELSSRGKSIRTKDVRLTRFERTSPSAANKLSSKLEKTSLRTQAFLVAMRLGVTPVPIPNTMVKTQTADGTALETVWESRWLPNQMGL